MAADMSRDLLFGLIALQNGLIDQAALVVAFQEWTRNKTRKISEILIEHKALTNEDRTAVEGIVDRQVQKFGDPESTVGFVRVSDDLRDSLQELGEAELNTTLDMLGANWGERVEFEGDNTDTADFSGATIEEGQRYQIIAKHDEGGQGVIFLAHDLEVNRHVALKLIHDKLTDEFVKLSFLTEAEVTGALEHPGIVPVYGMGTYKNGRPYYAMRFIYGRNLRGAVQTFHRDQKLANDPGAYSLELRAFLRKIIDACYALEYAHRRGVIHRDIKPANIVVGDYGETFVVDWGLAKTRVKREGDGAPEEKTVVPRTGSGSDERRSNSPVGTPNYMSPEQARGDNELLTPSTDIYGLGATLYYILTGRAPYLGRGYSVLDQVKLGKFQRPRELKTKIDRGLEAVCLKAMSYHPEGRYVSARAFAQDLENWLADEPVVAYPEPIRLRAHRWAKRHRSLVSSLGVFLCVSTIGLGLGLYFVNQERIQTDRARIFERQARKEAELLSKKTELLLSETHKVASASVDNAERNLSQFQGQTAARLEILGRAIPVFENLCREKPNDSEFHGEAGLTHLYEANIRRLRAEYDLAEKHYKPALRYFGRAIELAPTNLTYQDRMAEARRDLAVLLLRQGKLLESKQDLESALIISQELKKKEPKNLDYRRTEASILYMMPEIYMALLEEDNAERAALDVVNRYGQLVKEGIDAKLSPRKNIESISDRTVPMLYVMSLNLYADILYERKQYQRAIPIHQDASRLAGELEIRYNSPDTTYHYARTIALQARTLMRTKPNDLENVKNLLDKAIAILTQLHKKEPSAVLYTEMLSATHRTSAEFYFAQNQTEMATEELLHAHVLMDLLGSRKNPFPRHLFEISQVMKQLTVIEVSNDNERGANRFKNKALDAINRAIEIAPENKLYKRELKDLFEIPTSPQATKG